MHLLAAVLLAMAVELGRGQRQPAQHESCEALMVENCWRQVEDSADCLLNPRSPRRPRGAVCPSHNTTTLCSALEKALHCSSELSESGCALRHGRDMFDFWIRGLEAVNTKLCFESLMESVISHSVCWDAPLFLECVRQSVEGVQHVVDLVDVLARRDHPAHCHVAMLRIARCAVVTAPTHADADLVAGGLPSEFSCEQAPPLDVVNDLLAAFFSGSECGASAQECPPHLRLPRYPTSRVPTNPPADVPTTPTTPADPATTEQPPLCTSAASEATSATQAFVALAALTWCVVTIKSI